MKFPYNTTGVGISDNSQSSQRFTSSIHQRANSTFVENGHNVANLKRKRKRTKSNNGAQSTGGDAAAQERLKVSRERSRRKRRQEEKADLNAADKRLIYLHTHIYAHRRLKGPSCNDECARGRPRGIPRTRELSLCEYKCV